MNDKVPPKGRGLGRVTSFKGFGSNHIFGMGEARHFKPRVLIYRPIEEYWCTQGVCSGSRELFDFSGK